jgi:hypothetical protein
MLAACSREQQTRKRRLAVRARVPIVFKGMDVHCCLIDVSSIDKLF